MKKTIVLCLFCVIFSLISAPVCFAEDWDDDYDEFDEFDEFDSEDPYLDAELYDDVYDNSVAGPAHVGGPGAEASAAAAAESAASAANSAASAANSAESAATAAAESAASAAAAANSADSAAAANVAPSAPPASSAHSAPPQPPVRIVIPMMTAPPAQPAPPRPQVAPPAPPPAPAAPPVYRQQPPINVIPAMPNPYSNSVYRVQVGAFGNAGLAQQCFSRLRSAGFSPAYEPYGNVNRIVLSGIRAADMAAVVQRLAAAGFNEVWIREEK